MILVDANLLVYAVARELPQHETARAWLDEHINGTPRVGLPWPSLLSFMRLIANPRVFERPLPLGHAWNQVEAWLDQPTTWIPLPTPDHERVLGLLLSREGAARLVPDAHLATLAIEHGLTMCSTDGDFARFSDVNWENPLAAAS